MRVKLGIDPTAPDIHLGFTVVLQKMREFQDAGHTVVLIIGDGTARVGDPSGRSATRPILSDEQIKANADDVPGAGAAVLTRPPRGALQRGLAGHVDARVVPPACDDHGRACDRARRLLQTACAETPVSMLELLYPLLQGYDSVAIKADLELGGTDQKFNLLLGRDIQRAYGQDEQVILTMPLLTGIDGERKMSKSFGNYIGVTEAPEEMYGKTLRIPDESLPSWYELLLGRELPGDVAPRDAKRALARALVERFHGADAAAAAEEAFDRVSSAMRCRRKSRRSRSRGRRNRAPAGTAVSCVWSVDVRGTAITGSGWGEGRR